MNKSFHTTVPPNFHKIVINSIVYKRFIFFRSFSVYLPRKLNVIEICIRANCRQRPMACLVRILLSVSSDNLLVSNLWLKYLKLSMPQILKFDTLQTLHKVCKILHIKMFTTESYEEITKTHKLLLLWIVEKIECAVFKTPFFFDTCGHQASCALSELHGFQDYALGQLRSCNIFINDHLFTIYK